MEELIKAMVSFMNEQYGVDLKERRAKLREEFEELDVELAKMERGGGEVDDVMAEAGDVLAVLLHIIALVMPLSLQYIGQVVRARIVDTCWKMQRRVEDPNYRRNS